MEFDQINNEDSLINRGGMSIRGVNTELANLFRQYKLTINNILGDSQTFPMRSHIIHVDNQMVNQREEWPYQMELSRSNSCYLTLILCQAKLKLTNMT